jgi:hypothetical protein
MLFSLSTNIFRPNHNEKKIHGKYENDENILMQLNFLAFPLLLFRKVFYEMLPKFCIGLNFFSSEI